ncbi:hypothetical protein ACT2FY_36650 [Paraburkholderia fungorum]|uniref:hypothetical protein n=1 Tax=Paraburkholderia fungorum TaxID=134537 RepID=UPI00402BC2EF
MIMRIEVCDTETEEMDCNSAEEFEDHIRGQLDNGVASSAGGTGSEWMAGHEQEVIRVD